MAPPPSPSKAPTASAPSTSTTTSTPALSSLSSTPSQLRKFSLHPPSLLTASSILMTVANGTGPLASTQLGNLRSVLSSARLQATERLSIRDSNKKNLSERQANEKRLAEEQARVKEMERRRKREEDERKEKERIDKIERDRLQKEREVAERRNKEEEEFLKVKRKEEEEKIKEDEEKRLAAVMRAREKEKKKAEEAAAAAAATATASATAAAALAEKQKVEADTSGNQDVKMEDAEAATQTKAVPTNKLSATGQVPAITVESSPDVDEDEAIGQPRPPPRDGKKKKRKRDQVVDSDASSNESDSDTQPLIQKVRKLEAKGSSSTPAGSGTPSPSPTPGPSKLAIEQKVPETPTDPYEGLTLIERKLKEDKFVKHSIPIRPPAPGTATAFYLPSNSLVPSRPLSIPPISTPKRQSEVSGDFSNAKPGTQIAHHTFHTWADAYLRPFGEDDLAFLAPKQDDLTPYLIPPLGKHYTEQWEEEDNDLPPSNTSNYASPLEPPPMARIKPDALSEDALGNETVTLGPLSERLVAALAFHSGGEDDASTIGEDESMTNEISILEGSTEPLDPGAQPRALDAIELEDRIKRELRFIGLLPEEDVDWSTREDDEISSALRACQRQLHRQTTLNEARKIVLTGIVKDRMACQDYETTRDAQERVIENGWLKRQKTQVKKKGKARDRDRHKKDKDAEKDAEVDPGKQPLSLSLLQAVEKRHVLVESFRPFFEDERSGRFWGIPDRSVYEGFVEETPEGGLKGELVEHQMRASSS